MRGDVGKVEVNKGDLKKFLGLPTYSDRKIYSGIPPAGIITGLAYNAYGGSLIYIETMKSNYETADAVTIDSLDVKKEGSE